MSPAEHFFPPFYRQNQGRWHTSSDFKISRQVRITFKFFGIISPAPRQQALNRHFGRIQRTTAMIRFFDNRHSPVLQPVTTSIGGPESNTLFDCLPGVNSPRLLFLAGLGGIRPSHVGPQ
jgi:hypothetical protein